MRLALDENRGVAIYIKNRIKFSIVKSDIYRNNVWSLIINVKCKMMNGDFAIVYHSPCSLIVKYDEFLDYFEQWCENAMNYNKKTVICGDFNIDLRKSSTHSERVKKNYTKHGNEATSDKTNENNKTVKDAN